MLNDGNAPQRAPLTFAEIEEMDSIIGLALLRPGEQENELTEMLGELRTALEDAYERNALAEWRLDALADRLRDVERAEQIGQWGQWIMLKFHDGSVSIWSSSVDALLNLYPVNIVGSAVVGKWDEGKS